MSHLRLTFLAVTAVAALAACSTGPSGSSSTSSGSATSGSSTTSGADAAAYPVTIEHAFGETTIKAEPKRIVTLGWSDADHVAALGVAPVGAPAVTWGGNAGKSTDWFDAQLATFGGAAPTRFDDSDGAPIEDVALLNPDLILATNSGITKEEYGKLSALAPVVAYPEVAWGTPWEESLEMIGEALGREDQAEVVEDATEKVLADARTANPQLTGKTFVYAYLNPADTSQIGFYTPTDLRPRMLTELGLANSPWVVEQAKGEQTFYLTVSSEKAAEVKADILLTYITDDKDVATIEGDPLLSQIPAVKSGAVVATKDERVGLTMSSPTPLSIPFMVKDFVPLVVTAADKAAGAS